MRKFYLEIDGVRTSLNGEAGYLFTDPTGLGVTYKNSYATIDDGFFYKSKNEQQQGEIVGTLNILSSGYTNYLNFVNSVLNANRLVLVYSPLSIEYKCEVDISYITKTESIACRILKIPIAFKKKSQWYTEETLTGTGTINVTAGGQIATTVKLTTTGTAMTNPIISIQDSDGVAGLCALTSTILATDTVEYSNDYLDAHIYKTDNNGITTNILSDANPYQYIFGKTKKAFALTVTDDNSSTPSIVAIIRKYWRSV